MGINYNTIQIKLTLFILKHYLFLILLLNHVDFMTSKTIICTLSVIT